MHRGKKLFAGCDVLVLADLKIVAYSLCFVWYKSHFTGIFILLLNDSLFSLMSGAVGTPLLPCGVPEYYALLLYIAY